MSDAELIFEEVKTLSPAHRTEVLDFVGYLKEKAARQEEARKAEIDAEVAAAGTSWFERGEPCLVCAKHRDPVTGEELFNAETRAAIAEGRAMMRGEIPAIRYNSVEEMWADLMKDDDGDD
jgi:hypothetical protein